MFNFFFPLDAFVNSVQVQLQTLSQLFSAWHIEGPIPEISFAGFSLFPPGDLLEVITVVSDISFTLSYMDHGKLAPFPYTQWDYSQLTAVFPYSARLTHGLFPSTISHWWLGTHTQIAEWLYWGPSLDLRLAGTMPDHPSWLCDGGRAPIAFSKGIPLSNFFPPSLFYILTGSEEFKNHINSLWLSTLRNVLKPNL